MLQQTLESEKSPDTYVSTAIEAIRLKANRNEILTRASIIVSAIMAASLPILALIPDPAPTTKMACALIGGGVGVLNIWIQFENSQSKWKLYRGLQRRLEAERVSHKAGIPPYDDQQHADKILYERVRDMLLQNHADWTAVIGKSKGEPMTDAETK